MKQRDETLVPGGGAAHPTRGVFRREGEYWTLDSGAGRRVGCATRPACATSPSCSPDLARRWRLPRSPGRRAAARRSARPVELSRADTVRVTRAMRTAMARIARHHASLGEYLAATIKTGAYCSYAPERRIAPAWQLCEAPV